MDDRRRTMLRGALASAGAALPLAIPGLAALAAPGMAVAQSWPSKTAKIVVPYPPGGPTDIIARLVGQKLSEHYGQSFVIENKAGAGGNLGAEIVARSPADGYTLLVGTTAHAINPSVFKQLKYDILKDFSPVALFTLMPHVLVVNPEVPAKTLPEFIALAKTPGSDLAYASSGNGQSTHLAAELFKSMTGARMIHVPYKGSAPALTDVAGGQVAAMFDTMLSAMPQVKAGRLRALAVTSARRSKAAPELPTIAEFVPGYEATAWNGLLAPAGTENEVVLELNRAVNEILRSPEVTERLAADGVEGGSDSPAEFAAFIQAEVEKWAAVAKSSGAVLN
jgi:tripartite-type tricarboxylate transporter receptor subunit TctC